MMGEIITDALFIFSLLSIMWCPLNYFYYEKDLDSSERHTPHYFSIMIVSGLKVHYRKTFITRYDQPKKR